MRVYTKLKNLIFKITTFLHCNVHKFTWKSDGKTHSQIGHIMIDRKWHSVVLDVQLFRVAHYDTDHCLVVAKVRERPALIKQTMHKFHMEGFSLKKLNVVESEE
jgi:hypothetical protein